MEINPQIDAFQRPAGYWLKRAERCKQSGNLLRAVVLERHALRNDPQSEAAALNYVLTLRRLNCYEASTREAFSALARDPERFALYGLIGQNMMALGMRQEAMDAFALYMTGAEASDSELPPWDADVCDMQESYWELPIRRRARFGGLLRIAFNHIARGELEGANRALVRARAFPFSHKSARLAELTALYHERAGRLEHALTHARRAVALGRRSAQITASMACLFGRLGRTAAARSALMRAACLAHSPIEELLVCLASEQLAQPMAARVMLERSLKQKPDRYPVCYNLGVCLLKMGLAGQASRYIHLCRELDPDDVPGEVLFARFNAMDTEARPETLRRRARALSYYGTLSQAEMTDCLEPLFSVVANGPEALASALLQDDKLRRRFLYAVSLPGELLTGTLTSICAYLSKEEAIRLLREILLADPRESQLKRVAMAQLYGMGVKPPYPVWCAGHIASVDPSAAPHGQAPFLARRLTRVIRVAADACDDCVLAPWAMHVFYRMPRKVRLKVAGGSTRIWAEALLSSYQTRVKSGPVHIDIARVGRIRFSLLMQALHILKRYC